MPGVLLLGGGPAEEGEGEVGAAAEVRGADDVGNECGSEADDVLTAEGVEIGGEGGRGGGDHEGSDAGKPRGWVAGVGGVAGKAGDVEKGIDPLPRRGRGGGGGKEATKDAMGREEGAAAEAQHREVSSPLRTARTGSASKSKGLKIEATELRLR